MDVGFLGAQLQCGNVWQLLRKICEVSWGGRVRSEVEAQSPFTGGFCNNRAAPWGGVLLSSLHFPIDKKQTACPQLFPHASYK